MTIEFDKNEPAALNGISQTSSTASLKLENWNKLIVQLRSVTDALGNPIDEGIFDVVVGFNALNFPTSGSCEGHLKWGTGAPYIDIVAINEPTIKFKGEDIFRERLNITTWYIPEQHMDSYRKEYFPQGYTDEHKAWIVENYRLMDRLVPILMEFNQSRTRTPDTQIRIDGFWGRQIRITNADLDAPWKDRGTFTDIELLRSRQAEFRDFSDFLKEKYLVS